MGTEENNLGGPGGTLPGLHDFEIPRKEQERSDEFGTVLNPESKEDRRARLLESMSPNNILKGMAQAGAMHSDPEYARKVRTQIQRKLIDIGTKVNINSQRVDQERNKEDILSVGEPQLATIMANKNINENTKKVLHSIWETSHKGMYNNNKIDRSNENALVKAQGEANNALITAGIPLATLGIGFLAPLVGAARIAAPVFTWGMSVGAWDAISGIDKVANDSLGQGPQAPGRFVEGAAETMAWGHFLSPATQYAKYIPGAKAIDPFFKLGMTGLSLWAGSAGNFKTAGQLGAAGKIPRVEKTPTKTETPPIKYKHPWNTQEGFNERVSNFFPFGDTLKKSGDVPPTPAPSPAPTPAPIENKNPTYSTTIGAFPKDNKDFTFVGDGNTDITEEFYNQQKQRYNDRAKEIPRLYLGEVSSVGSSTYGRQLNNAYKGIKPSELSDLIRGANKNQQLTKANPNEGTKTWDPELTHMLDYKDINKNQTITVLDGKSTKGKVNDTLEGYVNQNGVHLKKPTGKEYDESTVHHEFGHTLQNRDSFTDAPGLKYLPPHLQGFHGKEAGARWIEMKAEYYRREGKPFEGGASELLKWGTTQKDLISSGGFNGFSNIIKSLEESHKKDPKSPSPKGYIQFLDTVNNNVVKNKLDKEPIYFNDGGKVPGVDTGEDSVLAMLRPGENVDTVEEVKADEAAANAPPTPAPTPSPTPNQELFLQKPLPPPSGTGVGSSVGGFFRGVGSALRIPSTVLDFMGLPDPEKDKENDRLEKEAAERLAEKERQEKEAKAEADRVEAEIRKHEAQTIKEAKEKEEKAKALKKKQDEEAAAAAKKAEEEAAAKAAEKKKREEEGQARIAAVEAENARKKKEQEDTAAAVVAKPDPGKKDPPAPVAEPPVKVQNPPKENIIKDIIPWLGLAAIQKEAMAFPTMVSGIPSASAPSFEKTHLEILYYTEAGL